MTGLFVRLSPGEDWVFAGFLPDLEAAKQEYGWLKLAHEDIAGFWFDPDELHQVALQVVEMENEDDE